MSPRRSGTVGCVVAIAMVACWLAFRPGSSGPGGSKAIALPPHPAAQVSGNPVADSCACHPVHPVTQTQETPLPLADDFPDSIVSKDGKTVNIPLPGGGKAKGTVTSLKRDAKGVRSIEGKITDPEAGRFMFQRQTVPGKAGSLVGFVLLDKNNIAWQVRPQGEDGKPVLVRTTADSVICRALAAPEDTAEIPPTHPDNYPIPPEENGVIQLQSLPGAAAVVYLDFDGEERVFDSWGYVNAQPSGSSNAQIYEVWKGVCEDYVPFNINITTVRAVYDAADEGRRIQVVITPTNTVAPGSGGVAYVGSFNWSGEMVCWSFYGSGKNGVEVISHEVGHTLGLIHDGRSPAEAYYAGHPGWAPIMGVGYYQNPSQWSKGEYDQANNLEDDIDIIANYNNDTGFRPDDHAENYSSATWLDITAEGAVASEGVIETQSDEDSFRFTTTGGDLNLAIENVVFNPNLDLKAEVLTSTGDAVAASDPVHSLDAVFIDLSLPAGDYFLRVSGTGKGDLSTGYSDYGSLGSFTVTGNIAGGVNEERFSVAENSPDDSEVGVITPRADHGAGVPGFSIVSGNTGGAFAIDPATGAITVAEHGVLDFEELSPRWDVPARFELFVEITDSLATTTETLRTVITVTDVNETPVFPSPSSLAIAEHLSPGTLITRVSATDPDRGDHVIYSIVGGNSGSAFAIDAQSGALTVAGGIVYQTTPSYTLTLRAADSLSPANVVDVSLYIQVLDTPDNRIPGSILRTSFDNIPGQTIASLTSHPNFPNKPNSEGILTSFNSGPANGDSYGSTIRGYLIAPVTGSYTFWISADDSGELRLSPDENPANAVLIANLTSATDPDIWNQPGQQSVPVNLTAGQSYYIEARHKESNERDHLQIAWLVPGGGQTEIIPGRWLAPYAQDYAPWAAATTFVTREAAINGQRLGTVNFVEPDIGQAVNSYAITGGNEAGLFAINPFSGDLSIANGGALGAGQSHVLTISATDNGNPQMTGQSTVTIPVLGLHEQLQTWWKLDEGAGSVVYDNSGNSHTASISGAASWQQRDAANSSLALNGSTARFSYTGGDGLSGSTSFTAAAWVKAPNITADGMLIQQYKSGGSGHIGRYLVYVKADGRINFSIYGRDPNNGTEAYQFDITTTASIKDNNWHHVACVRDGSTGRIFIDGVLAATGSGSIRSLDPSLTVAVGYDARNNNTYLKATVDDVRVYADALSGQQLLRIAGTPKLAVISPTENATLPSGVGLVLETAASDPDGPPPVPQWTQLGGPDTATLTATSSTLTHAEFPSPGTYLLHGSVTDGINTATRDISVFVGSTASSSFTGFSYGGAFGSYFDYSTNQYALIGSASGIVEGGTSDGFYMLGQSFTGDFDVRTRITSCTDLPENTNERAGLIIRAGTSGSGQEASGFIGMDSGNTGRWLRREITGEANLEDDYPSMLLPDWCRIVRTGSTAEFQHSSDGLSWITRGTMYLTGTVRVGLCWSSGNGVGFGSAAFDNTSGFSPSNTGPLVQAGTDFQTTAGFPASLNGFVSDDGRPGPGAPVTQWSKASGPGAVTFSNASSVSSNATFSEAGSYELRLTADDGAARTFDTIAVNVAEPMIVAVDATDADAAETGPDHGTFVITRGGPLDEDLTVDFTLGGSATNELDYAVLPSNVVIPSGETTATLDVAPLADALVEGTENVTIHITPGIYQISSGVAEITILDSNHQPAWSGPALVREDGTENQPYNGSTLATDASDPDGNPLTFSKVSGPAWLMVQSDGSLEGSPGPGDLGPNNFTVRVADPGGLSADADLEIVIHFENQPPAFDNPPLAAGPAIAGLPYTGHSLAGSASDENLPQGDTLTFSKVSGPAWLDVAADGSLSGTPPMNAGGPNEFTVRVSDLAETSADTTLSITVNTATLYFDTNGTDSGSGVTGAIAWDASSVWSLDALGESETLPWIEGAAAVLSAGTDAADCTITVTGSRFISGLRLEEGNVSINGDGLALTGSTNAFMVENSLTIGNTISGTSTDLAKSGPGTLVLSGENTYTGDTQVLQGILELSPTGRLYQNGPVTDAAITVHTGATWRLPDFSSQGSGGLADGRERRILDGGTFEITGNSHSSDRNFTVTSNGGTLRYTAAGQTLTLAGNANDDLRTDGLWTIDATGDITIHESLEGSGSLTKTGAGVLELTSSVSIPGPVRVEQGGLRINGTLSNSPVEVETTATLSGEAVISQSLDVFGTLSPGNSIGAIDCGALTLQTGASIIWQIADWTGTQGTGYDQVAASSLDLSEAAALELKLESQSLQNFTDTAASFVLIETTSGIIGFDPETITVDAGGLPEATGHWAVRVDGNQVLLDYTPLTPFETWQAAEFGPDASNPLIAGESADPDSDGHANLLEYALGTDPNLPSVTGITIDFESVAGTDFLRMTIQRNPNATDVNFLVEATSDPTIPESWSATDTLVETDTPTQLVVRDTVTGPRRMMRLRVTR